MGADATKRAPAAKRAALDDMRSVAVLLERIAVEWLSNKGYLDKTKETNKSKLEPKDDSVKRRKQ
jgi:hypothetical protein